MKTFYINIITLLVSVLALHSASAQACASPNTIIYGLTASGDVRPVNVTNAVVGAAMNSAYKGNAASVANGIGYNQVDGMFYYFKRNANTSPQEFVSFDPAKDKVKILASCPTTYPVRTGCVSFNGSGFYALDAAARLYYYNIISNTWILITSTFYNDKGANITSVFQSLNSGDIAIDGLGNLWILASNDDNYGLYKVSAPLPVVPVSRVTGTERISPASVTPTGSTFVGIAFNPTGQIYASTYADDRLYRIESNLKLTYIGKLSVANSGNDLTSCSFPVTVLPMTLTNFVALTDNHNVKLTWTDAAGTENMGYEIEHTTDQNNWSKAGFVARGTSGVSSNYSFTHNNVMNGDQYYRIKQTDANGTVTYSAIRQVSIKSGTDVAIWPNPAKEALYINSTMTGNVRLFDAFGRQAYTGNLVQGVNTLNVRSLAPGTYIAHLQGANGQVQTRQLVKQ